MKIFKRNSRTEPWQIAAARYCADHSENGFTKHGLETYIKSLYGVSEKHINQFYEEEISNPAGRKYSRSFTPSDGGGIWIPPLDLVSKITDYDELQEARESSRKAFMIATGSLIVAIIVGIVQIWTSVTH